MDVSLVSGDRDLLQIADEKIKIRIPKTKGGKTEIEDYYPKDVFDLYKVSPLQFIEWKALVGDTADNIPGVPKVGEKTATELLVKYGSIDSIYEHIEEIPGKAIKASLLENRDKADLSKTLATIKTDCDIEVTYQNSNMEEFGTKEAYDWFKRLGFKQLLSRFKEPMSDTAKEISAQFHLISSKEECVNCLKKALEKEQIGLFADVRDGQLKNIAFALSMEEVYFYLLPDVQKENFGQLSLFDTQDNDCGEEEEIKALLHEISLKCKIVTFDIKKLYGILDHERVDSYFDCLIAAYLLNPLKSDYDISAIALEHLGISIPSASEVFKKTTPEELFKTEPDKVTTYFGNGAYVALAAYTVLAEKLKNSGMDRLMKEIEMPLSLVLYAMEQEGIRVKREELASYGKSLVSRIEELEKSIYEQAGMTFNIQSPKQLGEVLFEKLEMPGGKKTKTGYSTAADVLEKLAGEYPIVKDILEYRGLTKLKSTYADGLANYIGEDGKIHTTLNQTITATGRISSTEPNLQNIPMRMELGRQIRKVFVPGEGRVFVDADYSQIELRVLAHMSGDEQLIEAYKMDADIHRITASKVFNTPFEEVTDLQRRNAKAVNFGIVYGISSFGLGQDLSISTKEAAKYIEQYFETYPKVKTFLNELVADCKKNGYVTTMYGRRRPVPEIKSPNFMQRSFGERIAMNSPIQGTAADIIKIAMINVYNALKKANLKSRLILQIHDELLIEAYEDEKDQVCELLRENMKEAAKLAVSLEVDLHTGRDWYEAK